MKYLGFFLILAGLMWCAPSNAQDKPHKFAQIDDLLPTPNVYRAASGAPGHRYWQQRADYQIDVTLDDDNQRIYGEETITYFNNSPDQLRYLWVQLDQNVRARDSDTYKTRTSSMGDSLRFADIDYWEPDFDGGFKIDWVKDKDGKDLPFTINKTMMRIDMPRQLPAGAAYTFRIKWWYNINDRMKIGGRSGYEFFEADSNYLYTIAQFYPRMAVYNDHDGWQHKQFLGAGEFTLNFGNYDVRITAPADHMVGSTGVLQNPRDVLSEKQRSRLDRARTADQPVMILSQKEAEEIEKGRASGTKTWRFKADNVRDFAFASSRKFIWDAQGVDFDGRTVMAMSYYPKEANPLWEQYSTRTVVHTLKTYSKFTFDYPYPVAISVNADRIGMEYPMICFNYGRCEPDGTYSERMKWGVIGVIIHEVGHNWFPMIVNSDERQWTWMDEGLNTFLQFLTEREFDADFPSRRGTPASIVEYMSGDKSTQVPIMTNSESVFQLGNNAYAKPTAALNILRETVMGRELFDFAFKEYANRWMFKHPTPADFFRTMEDASGVDLDWFWRGWFFTTDHVDISIDDVRWFQINTRNPEDIRAWREEQKANEREHISEIRNREEMPKRLADKDSTLRDFYSDFDRHEAFAKHEEVAYERYIASLSDEELARLQSGQQFYEITFRNIGGLVMPLILEFEYADGTKEIRRIPAEIWRKNTEKVTKVFVTDKEAVSIMLDPHLETADADLGNNAWPRRAQPSRFKLYKQREFGRGTNEIQRYQKMQEKERAGSEE
ncbi:MAG: M1 family peptidase [Cryomorphaceae bacterium]|nr:MAG: M1 family peptidase [Cryomorphaceae bacterium]